MFLLFLWTSIADVSIESRRILGNGASVWRERIIQAVNAAYAIAHADIDIPLVGGRVNFSNGTDEIGRDPNDLTPCEKELGNNSNGRYPRLISEQFPPLGTVVYEGPSRNMYCVCRTYNTMSCTIIVHMNSVEAQIVARRLDRSSRMDLLPFYVPEESASSIIPTPLMFRDRLANPMVYAEIFIQYDASPQHHILRSNSAPPAVHHTEYNINLNQCTGGTLGAVCPILQTPFENNDQVYVLKLDRDKVVSGAHVVCISAGGLRGYAQAENGSFRDPLNRHNRPVSLDDYDSYRVSDSGIKDGGSPNPLPNYEGSGPGPPIASDIGRPIRSAPGRLENDPRSQDILPSPPRLSPPSPNTATNPFLPDPSIVSSLFGPSSSNSESSEAPQNLEMPRVQSEEVQSKQFKASSFLTKAEMIFCSFVFILIYFSTKQAKNEDYFQLHSSEV